MIIMLFRLKRLWYFVVEGLNNNYPSMLPMYNRKILWLRDTVKQTSRGKLMAAGPNVDRQSIDCLLDLKEICYISWNNSMHI